MRTTEGGELTSGVPVRGQRRPYRVVFTAPGADGRTGTIVAADVESALREARSIALDGGVAQVQFVCGDGAREVLACFPPDATIVGTPASRPRRYPSATS